jgi:hypothetical protein
VDALLIASIAVSISLSALAVFGTFLGQASLNYNPNSESSGVENSERLADYEKQEPPQSGLQGSNGGGYGAEAPAGDGGQLGAAPAYMVQSGSTSVYESAPYILPISWGAVAGTLIWRGKVRSSWSRQGYDYDTFRLVARTRGSPIRVRLLNSVATAKNRLQLANELDVDWKTIDNHVEILTKSRLVQQMAMVGTTRYYVLTEHGRRVLSLLSEGQEATAGSQAVVSPLGTIGDSN